MIKSSNVYDLYHDLIFQFVFTFLQIIFNLISMQNHISHTTPLFYHTFLNNNINFLHLI